MFDHCGRPYGNLFGNPGRNPCLNAPGAGKPGNWPNPAPNPWLKSKSLPSPPDDDLDDENALLFPLALSTADSELLLTGDRPGLLSDELSS